MTAPKLYLETSVVSYLTAEGSRDPVLAAHQEVTRAYAGPLMPMRRSSFSMRPPRAIQLLLLSGCWHWRKSLFWMWRAKPALAGRLIADHGLPPKARVDALHVAIAAVHGMDYLLSWNCKHIANALLRSKIESICRATGFEPPVICTPLELGEE
jgi:hypothetical protein